MTHSTTAIVGWDIGGVNTKAARVDSARKALSVTSALSEPLAMERDSALLVPTLRRLATGLLAAGLGEPPAAHAVTMTAELSQAFRTKREGVGFVLDAFAEAFPGQTGEGLHRRGPISRSGGGPGATAGGRRIQLGGDRPVRRPGAARLPPGGHRDHLHRHHPDHRR